MKKIFSIVIVACILNSCSESKKKGLLPTIQDLTESVYSSVTIQPDSAYTVYSSVSGILSKSFVEEGDTIKEGDELVEVNNSNPQLTTENARLAVKIARENFSGSNSILKDIVNELNSAQLKCANDSTIYYRQKVLFDKNLSSQEEFDMKKMNYQVSKNQQKAIRNRYNRTNKELKNQLNQAQNNYESSLILTKDFTIKSKINGRVYTLNKKPGESINPQEPLALIGSAHLFIAELLIDEIDITKIKIGQQIIIHLDAYKNEIFKGKVTKIYPNKDIRSQTFKIEAQFIEKPTTLYPGLSGEGNIVINQKSNILTIPKGYINEKNEVKTAKGIVKVKTGLESLDRIEIISGINQNTELFKFD